jgi:hypothetical protein
MRGLYACFQVGRARAAGISDVVKDIYSLILPGQDHMQD